MKNKYFSSSLNPLYSLLGLAWSFFLAAELQHSVCLPVCLSARQNNLKSILTSSKDIIRTTKC